MEQHGTAWNSMGQATRVGDVRPVNGVPGHPETHLALPEDGCYNNCRHFQRWLGRRGAVPHCAAQTRHMRGHRGWGGPHGGAALISFRAIILSPTPDKPPAR